MLRFLKHFRKLSGDGETPENELLQNELSRLRETVGGMEALEAKLRETEADSQMLCAILSNLPVGITRINEHGVFTETKGSALKTVGLTDEKLVGLDALQAYPDVSERTANALKGHASHFESTINYQGQDIYLENHMFFGAEQGKGAYTLFIDVTARKQAERMLAESEAHNRAVVENIRDAITIAVGTNLVFVNPALLDILGLEEASQVLGHSMIDFIAPEDREMAAERTLARQRGESVANVYELRVLRADGTVRVLETSLMPITHDGQQASLGVLRDVTERKQQERELIRLERLRALGELSAGISHNLNNILSVTLGHAERLQSMDLDPKVLRGVDSISTSSRRAAELVRRLHQATRTGTEEALQPIPIVKVINKAIESTRPRWRDENEAKGVSIEMVTELQDVPLIKRTLSEIHDILVNLLLNATDALPEGGRISIATTATDSDVELTVSDSGVGMAEETRRRIFEPFFTTKMDVGRGLGLYTVYETIKRWGGTITVQSGQDRGTTFTLRFPMWIEPEEYRFTEPEAKAFAELHHGSSTKILVVDDEQALSDLLVDLLAREHEVTAAHTGKQGLESFEQARCGVALIDLGLPDVPGNEVAREMKESDSSVATVLVTGWYVDEHDPRLTPFDFRIQKPFTLRDLEDIVARATALHRERAGKS